MTLSELLRFRSVVIKQDTSVNYLGVYLDVNLPWKHYIWTKLRKTFVSLCSCEKAMDKNCGSNLKVILWLHRIYQYFYMQQTTGDPAHKIRGPMSCWSCSKNGGNTAMVSMRTTITYTLKVALGMPPLGLLEMHKAETTTYRLLCQKEWN